MRYLQCQTCRWLYKATFSNASWCCMFSLNSAVLSLRSVSKYFGAFGKMVGYLCARCMGVILWGAQCPIVNQTEPNLSELYTKVVFKLCFNRYIETGIKSPDGKVYGANMGPTCRTQVGPMLAPWTLLSGIFSLVSILVVYWRSLGGYQILGQVIGLKRGDYACLIFHTCKDTFINQHWLQLQAAYISSPYCLSRSISGAAI